MICWCDCGCDKCCDSNGEFWDGNEWLAAEVEARRVVDLVRAGYRVRACFRVLPAKLCGKVLEQTLRLVLIGCYATAFGCRPTPHPIRERSAIASLADYPITAAPVEVPAAVRADLA